MKLNILHYCQYPALFLIMHVLDKLHSKINVNQFLDGKPILKQVAIFLTLSNLKSPFSGELLNYLFSLVCLAETVPVVFKFKYVYRSNKNIEIVTIKFVRKKKKFMLILNEFYYYLLEQESLKKKKKRFIKHFEIAKDLSCVTFMVPIPLSKLLIYNSLLTNTKYSLEKPIARSSLVFYLQVDVNPKIIYQDHNFLTILSPFILSHLESVYGYER